MKDRDDLQAEALILVAAIKANMTDAMAIIIALETVSPTFSIENDVNIICTDLDRDINLASTNIKKLQNIRKQLESL